MLYDYLLLVSEMDEHVRIELLDPKWKEQKIKAAENMAGTNLISGGVIAENLKRISTFRSDIFDGDEVARESKVFINNFTLSFLSFVTYIFVYVLCVSGFVDY